MNRFLIAFLLISLAVPAWGQEAKAETPPEKPKLLEQAQQAKDAGDALLDEVSQHKQQLSDLQAELAQVKRMLVELERQQEKQAESIKAANEQLTKQQETVKTAETAKQTADKAAAEAAKALEDAKKKAEETAKAATTAATKLTEAQTQAKTYSENLAKLDQSKTELMKQLDGQQKTVEAVLAKVPELEMKIAKATKQRLEQDKKYEELLKQAGDWVSFSQEIAPLFQGQCVGCHSARNAKGEFNLETFAAMMQGGESGAVIDPNDVESSTLCIVLEDGSMPKDGDPLPAEQIELVKQWVKLGARLDVGVSPDRPLIRIMPREPQPTPPDWYGVPLPITAVAAHPNGTLLATSGYHEALLFSHPDGKLTQRLTNVAERVYDLQFSPDGTMLAVAAGNPGSLGEVKLFNIPEGTLISDLFVTTDAVLTLGFSPDGKRLAVAGTDMLVTIFDVESSEELLVIEDHADWIQGLAWSPDGNRLATASRDKSVKVFDAATGKQVVSFSGHSEPVYDVAFLPDGETLASGGGDRRVRIWKQADGSEIRSLTGFGQEVTSLRVLDDGTIATSCADGRLRRHQSSDGKLLQTYNGASVPLFSLTTTPDQKQLIGGCFDGNVYLWETDSAKAISHWSAAPPKPPTE